MWITDGFTESSNYQQMLIFSMLVRTKFLFALINISIFVCSLLIILDIAVLSSSIIFKGMFVVIMKQLRISILFIVSKLFCNGTKINTIDCSEDPAYVALFMQKQMKLSSN